MILEHIQKHSTNAMIEFVYDNKFSIVWATAQACCLLNINEDDIVSKSLYSFFDKSEFDFFISSLAETNGESDFGSVVHFLSSNEQIFLIGRAFIDENLRMCALITISELTKNSAIFEEVSRLRKIASTDMMTNLLNKVSFKKQVDDYLRGDGLGGSHCIILVDIDDFKKINDTYGHPFGDTIIFECSRAMSTLFRLSDLIGRIGGDEFMIFMKNVTHEIAKEKANELCQLINSYSCDKKNFQLSTSIGISFCDDKNYDFDMLYSAADIAMYESKRKGKGCTTTYFSNKLSIN